MSTFFRKALGLFVVLDEEQPPQNAAPANRPATEPASAPPKQAAAAATPQLSEAELSKFEKHFDQLFDQTNLPGPDYFEFWKTMDTLETHIPDEKARMKAVFASLKIQGLSKQTLLDTAAKYRDVILKDKASFESAVQSKSDSEIAGREASIQKLEKEREDKRQMIEKLQREIEESAGKIASLQQEIAAERQKIDNAQRGYLAACNAMVSKIDNDIQQFQQIIE